jgi:DNA repair protein RAD57
VCADDSAAGKSHFCLSLALAAQIPALTANPGGAMFLTSEREIATARLYELADHFLSTYDPRGLLNADDLLDNVLSNIVTDISLLEHTLMYKVPFILRNRFGQGSSRLLGRPGQEEGGEGKPIRVLIIDSITALIRGADSTYANSSSIGLAERSRYLCAVSDKLKALAVEFNLAVVVINQVSDVFTRVPVLPSTPTQPATQQLSQFYTDGPEPPMLYATQSRWFSGQTESLKKEASLGIVWANAINTRIMLSRTGRRRMVDPKDLFKRPKRRKEVLEVEEGEAEAASLGVPSANGPGPVVDDTAPMLIRRAHIVFSPFAPTATIDYIISPTGVHTIPDSYRLIDIAQTVRRRQRMAKAILGLDDDPPEPEHNEHDGPVGLDLNVPERSDPPSQLSQTSERVGESRGKGDDDIFDEFGDEVFDDFGDLPSEFWEGKMGEVVNDPMLVGGKL